MPIYEYNCAQCGNCFEALRFASDNEGLVCPKCGSPQVERQLSCFATGVAGGSGLAGLGAASSGGGGCGSGGFS